MSVQGTRWVPITPDHASKLSYMGHSLMENRSGLVVQAMLTQATGTAERDALPAGAQTVRPPPVLKVVAMLDCTASRLPDGRIGTKLMCQLGAAGGSSETKSPEPKTKFSGELYGEALYLLAGAVNCPSCGGLRHDIVESPSRLNQVDAKLPAYPPDQHFEGVGAYVHYGSSRE